MNTGTELTEIAHRLGLRQRDIKEGLAAGLSPEAVLEHLRTLERNEGEGKVWWYINWPLVAKPNPPVIPRLQKRRRGPARTKAPPPRKTTSSRNQLRSDGPNFFDIGKAIFGIVREGSHFRVYRIPGRIKNDASAYGVLHSTTAAMYIRRWQSRMVQGIRIDGDRLIEVSKRQKKKTLGRIINRWEAPKSPPRRSRVATAPEAALKLANRSRQLRWEILPAGWWKRLLRSGASSTLGKRHQYRFVVDRIEFLDSFVPVKWYVGSHLGNDLYYVAVFNNNLAIADCPEFGNALYYVAGQADRWQSVFRLTKREALTAGARRLIHAGNWRVRLRDLIEGSKSGAS